MLACVESCVKSNAAKALDAVVGKMVTITVQEADAKECIVRIVDVVAKYEGFWRKRPSTALLKSLQNARTVIVTIIGSNEEQTYFFGSLLAYLVVKEHRLLMELPRYVRIPKSLLEGKLPDVQRKMTNEVFADRNSIRNDIKEIMSLRETLKTAATLRQNMSTMFRAMTVQTTNFGDICVKIEAEHKAQIMAEASADGQNDLVADDAGMVIQP